MAASVRWVLRVLPAMWVRRGPLAQLGHKVRKGIRATPAQRARPVPKVIPVSQVQKVRLGLPVPPVTMARREPLASRDFREFRATLERRASKASPETPVPLALTELLALREIRARRVSKASKDSPGAQALRAYRASKATPATPEHKASKGIQGIQGVAGTNWTPVHTVLADDTLALALAVNTSVRLTVTANRTLTTTVPVAGSMRRVLILTAGSSSFTITFGSGFKPTGTLATGTTAARVFVLNFISDGTNLYEAGRTAAMVA